MRVAGERSDCVPIVNHRIPLEKASRTRLSRQSSPATMVLPTPPIPSIAVTPTVDRDKMLSIRGSVTSGREMNDGGGGVYGAKRGLRLRGREEALVLFGGCCREAKNFIQLFVSCFDSAFNVVGIGLDCCKQTCGCGLKQLLRLYPRSTVFGCPDQFVEVFFEALRETALDVGSKDFRDSASVK